MLIVFLNRFWIESRRPNKAVRTFIRFDIVTKFQNYSQIEVLEGVVDEAEVIKAFVVESPVQFLPV